MALSTNHLVCHSLPSLSVPIDLKKSTLACGDIATRNAASCSFVAAGPRSLFFFRSFFFFFRSSLFHMH